jgi:hypothetical protein
MSEREKILKNSATSVSTAFTVVVILAILSGFAPASAAEQGTVMGTALGLIQSEYESGNIGLDEKAQLELTAIFAPANLPAQFQPSAAAKERYFRSATITLLEIKNNWDLLSPETRSLASSYMTRPDRQFSLVSPSGYFTLHYDTLGTDAVTTTDVDMNGIPDLVEKCAAYCDTTVSIHAGLGYLLPPSDDTAGGDSTYDVYFRDIGDYGYTLAEIDGPEPWDDYTSYLVLNHTFEGFNPNGDPEGSVYGAAKATIAHEFHHAVQFAYSGGQPSWFMELDATYMEDLVFDQSNDNYNFLPYFFNAPQSALSTSSLHSYASFIFGLYLAQKFDTSLMVAIWEGGRFENIVTVLEDSLMANYGWTLDSAFAEFALWNYFTWIRDDGNHHEEAASYPFVALADTHSNYYPVPRTALPSARWPAGYAAAYVRFEPGQAQGNLRIAFDGKDTREWAAFVVKSISDSEHVVQQLTLSPFLQEGVAEIYDFENYAYVTLIGVNLSLFSAAETFYYSAELFGDFAVTSRVLPTDGNVYSGVAREFEYQVTNPSPLNDVYDVILWDDSGWVEPDTVDIFIPAGDSAVIQVPVYPPAGTPLSTSSTFYCRAVSKNDEDVFDEQFGVATTVLQHGDANFDGLVDIGDLTYIINFLYSSGPDPVPLMEAGNLDCEGDVDIGDLTALVRYLYLGGPAPPCNPF